MLIYSSPRLIAVSHVLLRLLMPRHSPYALFRLNFLNWSFRSIMRCPSSQIIFSTVVFSPYFALLAKFVVFNYTIYGKTFWFFIIHFIPRNKTWSFLIICSFLFLFIRFSMNCIHGDFIAWWRRSGSNRLPLECHSSALPGELRPRDVEIISNPWKLNNESI